MLGFLTPVFGLLVTGLVIRRSPCCHGIRNGLLLATPLTLVFVCSGMPPQAWAGILTRGCAVGLEQSSSSTGGAEARFIVACVALVLPMSWLRWWEGADAGGTPAVLRYTVSSRCPTSTASASPDSHDLNFSNRPVRTRMPGGVGGVRVTGPYPDQP
jgi:hypothetical protein